MSQRQGSSVRKMVRLGLKVRSFGKLRRLVSRRPSSHHPESAQSTPDTLPCIARRSRFSADNVLLLLTIASVILGVTIGFGLRQLPRPLNARELGQLKFMGELLVRALKALVLPLIACTLVTSLSTLNPQTAGRIGLYTIIYYVITTFSAVVMGIVLVTAIKPGSYANTRNVFDNSSIRDECKGAVSSDAVLDLFRNMFPDNLISATGNTERTCIKFRLGYSETNSSEISYEEYEVLKNSSLPNGTMLFEIPQVDRKQGMNVLGIIVFFVAFGIMVNHMGAEGEPVVKLFVAVEGAIMRLVKLVIWFSPIGILCLIAHEIVKMRSLTEEVEALGMYVLTVILGLIIHACVLLPILCFAIGRQNPFRFACGMMQALFTALGTASSAATMPLAIKCLEENNHIPRRISRFMIPLGATINMDGTALYEAVAVIYIAQTVKMELTVGAVIIVSVTATLASIGAAGIPQAGLVTMVIVLTAVGLPARAFVLIVPVDWFLDRIRTCVNVWGDCVGTAVISRLCKKQIEDEEAERVELDSLPQIIEKLPVVTEDTDDDHVPDRVLKSRPSASSFVLPIDSIEHSPGAAEGFVLKEVDISATPSDGAMETITEEGLAMDDFQVVQRGSDVFLVDDFIAQNADCKEDPHENVGEAGAVPHLSRSGYLVKDISG